MTMATFGESAEISKSGDGPDITGSISVEQQCRSLLDLPEFGLSTGTTISSTGGALTATKTLQVQG